MDTLSIAERLDRFKLRKLAHLIVNDSQVYSTQTDALTKNNMLPWQAEQTISRSQAEAETNAATTVIDARKLT